MLVFDDRLVVSVTDLTTGAQCEYGLLCDLDVRLGRTTAPPPVPDALSDRTKALGEAHEDRTLQGYLQTFGPGGANGRSGVVQLPVPSYDEEGLLAAHSQTVEALTAGADVVYQGSFYDGRMHGRADFLKKALEGYEVLDTKLARHAKVSALLQLAAYADLMAAAGIAPSPTVGLLLGDGTESWHRLADLLPVYRDRRDKVLNLLTRHFTESVPAFWGDPAVRACGRCDWCSRAVAEHRDVLLVAGLRMTQRERLRDSGITTIEQLAASTDAVPGIGSTTLSTLREQAGMQVAQDERPCLPDGRPEVHAQLTNAEPIQLLPSPDAGDIAFDFEGDPLWTDGDPSDWGLEYLFGVVESETGQFRPFWAHDRGEERRALLDFLDYVAQRRADHPDMHIYHYAAYEKSALTRLASRHGVGEDEVDQLLREGVLVDLYSVVRQSVRVSQPSYSIKKLEPLYMGDQLRGEVVDGLESVNQYALACDLVDHGEMHERDAVLEAIAGYNEYDCRSTLALRDWLRGLVAQLPVIHRPAVDDPLPLAPDLRSAGRQALVSALLSDVDGVGRSQRSPEQQGRAMLAAAVEYHRRELRPFWWAHFDRLSQPVDEWLASRDVFVVTGGQVVRNWYQEGRQRKPRRHVELTGEWGPGTSGTPARVFVIYDQPPAGMVPPGGCLRAGHEAGVIKVDESDGVARVTVEELLPDDVELFDELPFALGPSGPPNARRIEGAIQEMAARVVAHGWRGQPALDLLVRRPPRVTGGLPPLPVDEEGAVATLVAVLRDLDRSYLAVQGPPGTGKTHLGARVVRDLVSGGWRVGVVAQSHAVVETFLDKAVEAGLSGALIGKAKAEPRGTGWQPLADDGLAAFLADPADTGCLVGGTAWDFAHDGRVARGLLDLLVVDEAGQFAVANVVGVSVCAQRLMLLGDPRQLPQVSQGTHPEPVNDSALGWLLDGAAAMPEELGYFLERTWRMHPDLCQSVSRLAYDDRVHSHVATTTGRSLQGADPGVHVVEVEHRGNAVESPEEAAEVVTQVRALLGRAWVPEVGAASRPLDGGDVLVVAAYNAQVAAIRRALDEAALSRVVVGTVDKLQGREAPIVLVSMAASSPADVPRGMEFLLSRNRVNVAVSRAQWAAYVIRSPLVTDYLPATPDRLAELGAFLGLAESHTADA